MKIMMKSIFALTAVFLLFTAAGTTTTGVGPGDKAPGFTLKNIDGRMVSLSDYEDEKGVIVVFTCNHCPYAKLYEQRIIELNNKYQSKGFPVVAIQPNDPVAYPEDSFENMKKRASEKGYTFPYLIDESQDIVKAYGAMATPHFYLLENDKNGYFTVRYTGALDDNYKSASDVEEKYVEKAIDAMMAGDEVSNQSTKAIGCSIKLRES